MEESDEGLRENKILELEKALANIRSFLDQLEGSDTPAHEHIGEFAEDLERRLNGLLSDRGN